MQVADDDVLDAVGRDAESCEPSRTGLIISRWRFLPIASSKPVSTTMVPDGPTIAQTKKSSGCSTSCGSPSM
jgi:hypothetical protein